MVRFFIDTKGYKHFANSGKSVHRHVAEQKLSRKLKKGEVVHHFDFDKTNNHIDNLHLFSSNSEHWTYHLYLRRIVREALPIQ